MTALGKKSKLPDPSPNPAERHLSAWNVKLEGDWSQQEIDRIVMILLRLSERAGGRSIPELFNGQPTILHHSGRPGRVGRTRGCDIYLDDDWTDWTLAHELGHRWNNAWRRLPERGLRKTIRAGKLEWVKKGLRRIEKWLENLLQRLGYKARLDWHTLWYHAGDAPPPCGVDRNFNASEDLAECFAATLLQEDAQRRARKAAERTRGIGEKWNWPSQFSYFSATPRGQLLMRLLKDLSTKQENPQQTNCPPAKDQ